MKLVRYTSDGGEWSALYVDGKLERVGDHYLIDERISQLAGVEEYSSDAFLQGGNNYGDVAKTLDEVHAYEAVEADRASKVAELEAQAAALIAQANELREAAKTV